VHSASSPYSGHSLAGNVAWVSPLATGDLTGDTSGALLTTPGNSLAWIHSLDVFTTARPVVVALGDSVTDGYVPELHYEWPAQLAKKLGRSAGVVNAGMVANNLRTSKVCVECNPAMATRLDHDALDLPGVTDVVVHGGLNDITQLTPVSEIESGYLEIAARAHAKGIKVIAATLTPRQDWYQYYKPELMSPMRHEVNDWMRSPEREGTFDAVVDFDAAIRDPMYPDRMWLPYDSGDRMHPNTLGMQKLAATIDPRLLISN
jgi:lysophospholipase L1-like esterase